MKEWRAFMKKYVPNGDVNDGSYVFAYGISQTMLQVLKQCKGDFSRKNVMHEAENLHNLEIGILCRASRSTPATPITGRSSRCSCSAGPARPGSASAV